jgi:hypothetical protein
MDDTLIVNVTQKHINEGRPASADGCPIALALTECGFTEVSVLPNGFFGKYKGQSSESYELPQIVNLFIRDFDDNKAVLPTSFEISLIPHETWI